jgi:hypothetical protein
MKSVSKTIVIAAYTEDLSWTERLGADWRLEILSKNEKTATCASVCLPNTGREAHSYLWYISKNYTQLPELCVFCQGWPFDHSPRFLDELANFQLCDGFSSLSGERAVFDSFGMPHLVGAEPSKRYGGFYDFYKRLFLSPPPPLMYARMNALFAVTREAIQRLPRDFYETAAAMCDESTGPESQRGAIEAHYFERVWHLLFAKDREAAAREPLWSMPAEERTLVADDLALWKEHFSQRRLQEAVSALISANQKLAARYRTASA